MFSDPGMLFQVVVQGILLYEDQVVNREAYLERRRQREEEYKNMTEYEKRKYNSRVAMKGFHT